MPNNSRGITLEKLNRHFDRSERHLKEIRSEAVGDTRLSTMVDLWEKQLAESRDELSRLLETKTKKDQYPWYY